ncbi:unnamed protein product [Symbiodinium pilosum]|uniref:Uncharacterized protein n=1 Tax=Symbiodinium pilosum TaxID=2952 RepID=A0A812ITK3_SYMPI|nr:unnamed protein product [Symbiodinium pilosum]
MATGSLRSCPRLSTHSVRVGPPSQVITLQVVGALALLPVSAHLAAKNCIARPAFFAANLWLVGSARSLMLEVDKHSMLFVQCWGKHGGQRVEELTCVDRYSAFLTGANAASNAVVAKTGSRSFMMFSVVWLLMTTLGFSM